jgi:hypothetical protein
MDGSGSTRQPGRATLRQHTLLNILGSFRGSRVNLDFDGGRNRIDDARDRGQIDSPLFFIVELHYLEGTIVEDER